MRHRFLCLVFFGLIIYISISYYFNLPIIGTLNLSNTEIEYLESNTDEIVGVIKDRIKNEDGYKYVMSRAYLNTEKNNVYVHKLKTNAIQNEIKVGSKVVLNGKVSFYEGPSNPGEFNSKLYYAGKDIYASVLVKECRVVKYGCSFSPGEIAAGLKEKLHYVFVDAIGETHGGILSAMLLGDKSDIDSDVRSNYSVSGLGHVLAISGLHVGIIGSFILGFLIMLGLGTVPASIMSVIGLFLYCMFSGGGDSTLRAFIMFTVYVLGRCLNRSYDMLNSLSLAGVILLLINPWKLFSSGFLLSFGAVFGLCLIYPVIKPKARENTFNLKIINKLKKGAAEGFFVWLSVSMFTMPIMLQNYCETPLYGVLANIIFVPMTETAILSGIAGGIISLVIPFLGYKVLIISKFIISLQNLAGAVLKRLPYAMVITGAPGPLKILFYYIGLIGLVLLLREKWRRKSHHFYYRRSAFNYIAIISSILLMTFLFVRPPRSFSITSLDVGQGDANIIVSDKGKTVIIDSGSSSKSDIGTYTIAPYLKHEGISRVYGIFLTHSDKDHMSGIYDMFKLIKERQLFIHIDRLFMPWWMQHDETGEKLQRTAKELGIETIYLKAGDKLDIDNVELYVLSPSSDSEYTGNEGSLVVSVSYQDFRALFTGDLEGDAESELSKTIGKYHYLKAAHHGSNGSTKEEFLDAVKPRFVLISAPAVGAYNHPGPDTIKRIEERNIPWLQTGFSGAIMVTYDNGVIDIKSYK